MPASPCRVSYPLLFNPLGCSTHPLVLCEPLSTHTSSEDRDSRGPCCPYGPRTWLPGTRRDADSVQPPTGPGGIETFEGEIAMRIEFLAGKIAMDGGWCCRRTAAFNEAKPSGERHVPSTCKELSAPKRPRSCARGSEVDVERSPGGANGRTSCVWSPRKATSEGGEQHASEQTTELQFSMPWWKGTCGTASEVFRLSSGSYHQGRHGAVHCERMQATRAVEDGD